MTPPTPRLWPFFLLTLIIGCVVFSQRLDVAGLLAQGDHGRDLYVFERTLHGERPYQDYWWVYGPLMPYYYAFFDMLFGVQIPSVLLGYAFLQIVTGLFVFGALAACFSPVVGLLGAAWMYVFGSTFFHTYNHAGGLVMVACLVWCMAQHVMTQKNRYLWIGMGAVFVLAMIKINFAAAGLVALAVTAWLADRIFSVGISCEKKFFYGTLFVAVPLAAAVLYAMSVRGLSPVEIAQCFPYAVEPHQAAPWEALGIAVAYLFKKMAAYKFNLCFAVLLWLAMIQAGIMFLRRPMDERTKRLGLLFAVLSFYYLLNWHEFIKSGMIYRGFWSQPIGTVWMFGVIAMAGSGFSRRTRMVMGAFIIFLMLGWQKDVFLRAPLERRPEQFMEQSRAQVFVHNTRAWISTVRQTTDHLQQMLGPQETFLALPHDPLYYYLTGRVSPTRMLFFSSNMKIPPQQERKIIAELERKNVNVVVLSSRIRWHDADWSEAFGVTYCPLLAQYIRERFVPVARFGDWQNNSADGAHGTMVLKRK